MDTLDNGGGRGLAPRTEYRVGCIVTQISEYIALAGGLVLVFLMLLTTISVTGRGFIGIIPGAGPVPGDFEIVEAGCAFAVFIFLPWAQLKREHVSVDIAVSWMSPRSIAMLSLISNILLTAVAALIAWQLYKGAGGKFRYNETTQILQFPVWWGYAASLIGAVWFVVVSAYTVWRSVNEVCGDGEGTR
ncbi:MAG: TRAP transporter small permease [Cohaesibacteraceae bacterium]|nr:TRAP transporter small permease [Cohaesibacteraceae bacterium]MBL4874914.1 TRAP transporter small permease [Cohaesibacteraceae bacterium]